MILDIWKNFGDSPSNLCKDIKNKYNSKKVCFTGRLDPLAQGSMIILTDEDIYKADFYRNMDKTYSFEVILGISTDSHDCMGNIINKINMKDITIDKKDIINFISNYNVQEYPIFSSRTVEYEGKMCNMWKLYKEGIKFDIPKKNVCILNFDIQEILTDVKQFDIYQNFINMLKSINDDKLLKDFDVDKFISQYEKDKNIDEYFIKISMKMKVSSGFYIRKFCNDLGIYLGFGSIAYKITRESSI